MTDPRIPDALERAMARAHEAERNKRIANLESQLVAAHARETELRTALLCLSNEVIGSLPLFEAQTRRDIGNSNYAILIQRAEEARAVLSATPARAQAAAEVIAAACKFIAAKERAYAVAPLQLGRLREAVDAYCAVTEGGER